MTGEVTATGSMQEFISAAKTGELTTSFNNDMRLNAEEFAGIIKACQAQKAKIKELQEIADSISNRQIWGLGEAADNWIESGKILVSRFKSKGSEVKEVLQKHWTRIDEIEQLHVAIAQRFEQADATFASRYQELLAA
ncbi:hypothetical protein ACFVMC_23300 [Nocardia sp. NPDC127579]|uniref:hypothetical protein n=1 Tax=Nocardia sp. NPDC127579 TaxID=3345402 RepID=UPI0036260F56